ncbi:MAG: DUF3137 domain-containing protein [Cyclobacteriaceae bacterium]|nr:DUF3137 domain-containing protein [Cyclobacteriaceae bacterium]
MASEDSLRAFYDASLLPVLQEIEAERQKVLKALLIHIGIGLAAGIPLFAFASPIAGIAAVVIAAIVFFIRFGSKIGELKKRFKEQVIGQIVKFIHADLSFDHTRFIPQSVYNKSKLYLSSISRYNGDDMVSGTVGKTNIRFSELHTQQVRKTGKSTTVVTIFRGLFFVADFNKNFVGETFVLPDTAESTFGGLGTFFQKMNMSRPKLVKLEDIEFEKAFAVYGSDQIEARYILSTALMQRILTFKKKTRCDISLSFIDSSVFIGIPVNKDLFEAPMFSSMINYSMIAEYYSYLTLCIGIVEDLDLNTRIWSKE